MSFEASRAPEVAVPRPAGLEASPLAEAGEGGLEVAGMVRSYRDQPILQGLDLSVPRGSCVLVSGTNGVGKTTLLRVIAGIITPHGGTVTFAGLDPARDRRAYQRRVGLLAAGDRAIYARLTVRQNLEFWARIALLRKKSARQSAVNEALARFGLSDLGPRRSDRLSMGQRQRVRLAMTFLHAPDLVLLDEPTTSLDQDGGLQVRRAVEEATSRGASVVCCAPSGEEDILAFDRAFEIKNGTFS